MKSSSNEVARPAAAAVAFALAFDIDLRLTPDSADRVPPMIALYPKKTEAHAEPREGSSQKYEAPLDKTKKIADANAAIPQKHKLLKTLARKLLAACCIIAERLLSFASSRIFARLSRGTVARLGVRGGFLGAVAAATTAAAGAVFTVA